MEVTENESSLLQYKIDFVYLKKNSFILQQKKVLSSEVVVTSVRDLSVVKL